MALRALLLSPDDQAVHAITGVLEEMSVSCDRPLDGATAAKKLNSERFDLVVVDCENLPAAKLIFDVCRRSHGGASVPVAIVDGRAGLPTAFRLGAELILTKPVAMDQARGTIRTAVSRTRKDQPAQEEKPDIAVAATVEKQQESIAPKAMAAAAGAGSGGSAPTTVAVAATAPVLVEAPVASSEVPSTPPVFQTTAPDLSTSSNASAAATAPAIAIEPVVTSAAASSGTEKQTVSEAPTPVRSSERQLSEDPVMEALENDEPTQTSSFSAFEQPRPERSRRLLLATLLLALAGGTGYAAWMYQPGFRKFIELRIEQGKTRLGLEAKRPAVTIRPNAPVIPIKPAAHQAAPAPVEQSTAKQSSSEAAPPAANNISATATSAANAASVTAPATAADSSTAAEPQKKVEASAAAATDFPEAKNVVILSSKGAERRLLHRVAPAVPAEVRGQSAEATVVLKALIDEDGTVMGLQTVEGDAALASAAMKAVKQWRYKPYMRDGKALPFQTIVLVDFQ